MSTSIQVTTSGDGGYTTMTEESDWNLAQEVAAAKDRTGDRESGMPGYVTWIETPGMTVEVTRYGVFRVTKSASLCQFATPMPVAGRVSA